MSVASCHAAHDAGADGTPALTHREAHPLFERDGMPELELDFGAVAGAEHALGEQQLSRYVRGTEVELGRVAGAAGGLATTLGGAEQEHPRRTLAMGRDGAARDQGLTANHLVTTDTAQQQPHVVSGHCARDVAMELLDTGDDDLARRIAASHDFDLAAEREHATLDAAGDDGAATGDRAHAFDRHHERSALVADGQRDLLVERLDEACDAAHVRIFALAPLGGAQGAKRRAAHERSGFEAVNFIREPDNVSSTITLRAKIRPSAMSEEIKYRIQATVAAFNRESAQRTVTLKREAESLRAEIAAHAATHPQTLGGRSTDEWWKHAIEALQEEDDPAPYREYRTAVFEPGLSPEQRRLLFAAAVRELRLPLPGGEFQP